MPEVIILSPFNYILLFMSKHAYLFSNSCVRMNVGEYTICAHLSLSLYVWACQYMYTCVYVRLWLYKHTHVLNPGKRARKKYFMLMFIQIGLTAWGKKTRKKRSTFVSTDEHTSLVSWEKSKEKNLYVHIYRYTHTGLASWEKKQRKKSLHSYLQVDTQALYPRKE